MEYLKIGKAYKEQVLDEWRTREAERDSRWREMVLNNRFNPVKLGKQMFETVRAYVSGEFGEPTLKDKRDFLFHAVEGEFFACKVWLLKFGEVEGAIDCQNELDGKTALSIACEASNVKLTNLLLSREADTEVRDRFGCVALHYAAEAGSFECVQLLLEAGAEVDVRNRFGVTPLMKGAEVGDPDIVDLLLEYAAVPGRKDKIEKWTALHYAAKGGDVDTIMTLLKVGVPYDGLSTSKQSPQDVALDNKRKDAAILLTKWRRRILFPKNNYAIDAMDELDLDDL